MVSDRAQKLNILCLQGIVVKKYTNRLLLKKEIFLDNVIYVGNDIND